MKIRVITKTCYVCGEEKPLPKFTTYKKRSGEKAYNNRCKECANLYKKNHYENNKEAYLTRSKLQKEKDSLSYKEYQRKYHKDHKEELSERSKEYYSINKEKICERRTNWRRKPINAFKERVRSQTMKAVKKGLLTRPKFCSVCGREVFVEAHHEDYNKPLEVIWVCKSCHENIHHLNEGDTSLE